MISCPVSTTFPIYYNIPPGNQTWLTGKSLSDDFPTQPPFSLGFPSLPRWMTLEGIPIFPWIAMTG